MKRAISITAVLWFAELANAQCGAISVNQVWTSATPPGLPLGLAASQVGLIAAAGKQSVLATVRVGVQDAKVVWQTPDFLEIVDPQTLLPRTRKFMGSTSIAADGTATMAEYWLQVGLQYPTFSCRGRGKSWETSTRLMT